MILTAENNVVNILLEAKDGLPNDNSGKLDKLIRFGADIDGEYTFTEDDNSKLFEVVSESELILPDGLPAGWNVNVVNVSEYECTVVGNLRVSEQNKLMPNSGCVIYHKEQDIFQAIGLES